MTSLSRVALLGTFAIAACESAPELGPEPNPIPVVFGTDPGVLAGNDADALVEIRGTGFVQGAEVHWNGVARPTSFEANDLLSVTLGSADVAAADTAALTVWNPGPGGGTSNDWPVFVGRPVPRLDSVWLTMLTPSLGSLRLFGARFVPTDDGSVVSWNGVALPPAQGSATELVTSVPDYLLRGPGVVQVAVRNPPPGGGTTASIALTRINPTPVVTATDPAGTRVGTASTLVVRGSGFAEGATVLVGATRLTPATISSAQLTFTVPANLNSSGAVLSVRVETVGPGGGLSNAWSVPVWELPPVVDSLSPPAVAAGAPAYTLRIRGSRFMAGVTVTWNGVPHAATRVNTTTIQVPVSAADVAAQGPIDIRVSNPVAGGVASTVLDVLPAGLIAYVTDDGNSVVVSTLDGRNRRSIAAPGSQQLDASPTDSRVAVARDGRIYLADLDAGTLTRLTSPTDVLYHEEFPRFTADGQWVYFQGNATGYVDNAWRIPVGGGTLERMGAYQHPSISTSGQYMIYSAGFARAMRRLDYSTYGDVPLGKNGTVSRWTADDQWIAYSLVNGLLKRMRPDGSQDETIGPPYGSGSSFDWSPDGQFVITRSPIFTPESSANTVLLIHVPTRTIRHLTHLDRVAAIVWFDQF